MRRIQLAGTFAALVLLLCLLWAWRFERTGLPAARLADFRAAAPASLGGLWLEAPDGLKLRLHKDSSSASPAVRLSLPDMPVMEALHVRYRLTFNGLVHGAQAWEDGRLILEWHQPGQTSGWESVLISSPRLDQLGHLHHVVIAPDDGPAVPMLRIEHLGRAGDVLLSELEITPVRERLLWKAGRWFLIAGWLAWLAAFVKSWPHIAGWRAFVAALVMVLTSLHFVVPGPWKVQRALLPEFQIGKMTAAAAHPHQAGAAMKTWSATIPTGVLPAMGKLPETGGLALRVKQRMSHARPFLHALLLLGPVLACACLVGRKPALWLGILLSFAVEAAQIGFGYGCDWDDVLDLCNDAVGIAAALLLHRKLAARFPRKWFARTV
jgi:hypothetical protein